MIQPKVGYIYRHKTSKAKVKINKVYHFDGELRIDYGPAHNLEYFLCLYELDKEATIKALEEQRSAVENEIAQLQKPETFMFRFEVEIVTEIKDRNFYRERIISVLKPTSHTYKVN